MQRTQALLKTALAALLLGAAGPAQAQAQRPVTAVLRYTSGTSTAATAQLNLYVVLFNLDKNAAAQGARVRVVRGPNAKAAFVFVLRGNEELVVAVRTPTGTFASFDPAVIGTWTVQLNNGAATAIEMGKYNAKAAMGVFSENTTVTPALGP